MTWAAEPFYLKRAAIVGVMHFRIRLAAACARRWNDLSPLLVLVGVGPRPVLQLLRRAQRVRLSIFPHVSRHTLGTVATARRARCRTAPTAPGRGGQRPTLAGCGTPARRGGARRHGRRSSAAGSESDGTVGGDDAIGRVIPFGQAAPAGQLSENHRITSSYLRAVMDLFPSARRSKKDPSAAASRPTVESLMSLVVA